MGPCAERRVEPDESAMDVPMGQIGDPNNSGNSRRRIVVGAQGEFTLHALCHNLATITWGNSSAAA